MYRPSVPSCPSRPSHRRRRRPLSVRPAVRPVVVVRPLSVRPVVSRRRRPLSVRPSVRPGVRPVAVFGKVPHVALVRFDSFDEGVCDCLAGALRIRVPKVRIFMLKRSKIDQQGYPKRPTWTQRGAKREPTKAMEHSKTPPA